LGDGSYGIIYGLALVTTAMYFHLRIDDGESRFGHYLEELQRFTGISYRELTAHDEWSIRGVAEEALVAKAQEVLELRQANMNTPRVHWEAKEAQLAHEFEWRHTVTTALGLASGPFGKYYDAARDRLGSEG
jgi:hypothetical protein